MPTERFDRQPTFPATKAGLKNTRANYTTAQTNTQLITAQAGEAICITRLGATVDDDATVAVSVVVGFGTTATPTTDKVVTAHPGIPAGLGVLDGTGAGVIGRGEPGEHLFLDCSVPTSGSVDVFVAYYIES